MVHFIGIGPGGKKGFLTLEALYHIENADMGIYIGEMIGCSIKELFLGKPLYVGREISVEDVRGIIHSNVNKKIAFLLPGDVSLYSGQINEQATLIEHIFWLKKMQIPYTITSGVSSASAACAALGVDLTSLSSGQSVVMFSAERSVDLGEFSDDYFLNLISTKPKLILFQSFREWGRLRKLLLSKYKPSTKVVFAYKISWEDELYIKTDLANADAKIQEHNIDKHTLILIGDFYETIDGQG